MTTNTEWAVRYERQADSWLRWETITYEVKSEDEARTVVAHCIAKKPQRQRNYQVVRRTTTDWESA